MEERRDVERSDVCNNSARCLLTTFLRLPLHPRRSLRSRENADMRGLSCILLPFFPRNPQRLARLSSSPVGSCSTEVKLPDGRRIAAVLRLLVLRWEVDPPRIAETLECAQRACLRMAEVTVMHSVVTSATGSIAMATRGLAKLKLRDVTASSVMNTILAAVKRVMVLRCREHCSICDAFVIVD